MKLNSNIIKFSAIVLLGILGADALVITDMLEGIGFGVHGFTNEFGEDIELHFHEEDEADETTHAEGGDTCVLCICCVSSVNILLSIFDFTIVTIQNGVVFEITPKWKSHISSPNYRPPTISLS